jgi:RHS repeat-associated protein
MIERDDVSGLDHTSFRKLESRAGRWTSPDPYSRSQNVGNPQSFNRFSYVGNDPVNLIDPTGLVQCFNVVLITLLIDPGNPPQEIGRQILRTFCVDDTARDASQKIYGQNKFNGKNITRTDRITERLTNQQMQKLRDLQNQKQKEKDDCFAAALGKKRDGMGRVERETPPTSGLLTEEDIGITGTTSVLTSLYTVYKGAEIGAVIGAGVESGGLAVAGIILYRGTRDTVKTGLAYDQVNAEYKKDFDDCTAKHGHVYSPVTISSVAKPGNY